MYRHTQRGRPSCDGIKRATLAPLHLDNFQRLVSPILIDVGNIAGLPEKLACGYRDCTARADREHAVGEKDMGVGQIVSVLTGFFSRCQPNAIDAGLGLLLIKDKALCVAVDGDRTGLGVIRTFSANPYDMEGA